MGGLYENLSSFYKMSNSMELGIFSSSVLLEWEVVKWLGQKVNVLVMYDNMGLMFSTVVLVISFSVLGFSSLYMQSENFKFRFIYLVILFVMFMNILIYFPSMLGIMVGWDGLGVLSFFLVIYYNNFKSVSAGMITFLSNRLGDSFIILGFGMVILSSWDSVLGFSSESTIIWVLFLFASMTKSAQVPFSAWLPAAMAAPTPVSALVHSSTLVTAGMFLVIRFYSFFNYWVFFFVGGVTSILASFAAATEYDMKKIVALSTLSNLGLMFFALGVSKVLCFFHLCTHAVCKALMFISVGILIYFYFHSQDLRSYGDTWFSMPLVSSAFMGANWALSGFPFLACFFSKDMILESVSLMPFLLEALLLFMMSLTGAYSSRMSLFVTEKDSLSNNIMLGTGNSMKKDFFMVMFFFLYMAMLFGAFSIFLLLFNGEFYVVEPSVKMSVAWLSVLGISFTINKGKVQYLALMMGELLSGLGLLEIFSKFLSKISFAESTLFSQVVFKSSVEKVWVESVSAYKSWILPSLMFMYWMVLVILL